MLTDEMRGAALAFAFVLAGCGERTLNYMEVPEDAEVFQYAFERCITAAKGPERTHYNDWDDAIEACEGVASMAAKYCPDGEKCYPNVNRTRADVRAVLPEIKP